ncbi:pilus assembly protein CpaF [Lacrimispora xylanisolvens]|uniref:Pilus assembly protein CpaF n=1 Tax=Lacrimispora xylanisolvens TaxID=384636 RepID=A0A2S6HU41_9FIRM|nr:CpaF family protein [Hungatella xylanolytica]MBE5990018.1 CpaF family protein [Paenibacillaceae bacterium]PPK81355.1 pilus assembly protein CpaF [Hungatella xylanolytica]
MEWVSRLGQPKETNHSASKAFSASSAEPGNRTDKNYDKLKQTVHQEVIREYNDRFSDNASGRSIDVMEIIHQAIARQEESLTRLEESKLAQEIHDDVMGLGPLEPLLRDDSISEIMVNSARQIYIERGGRLEQTPASFRDDAHVLKVINRIVSSVGRRCDEATPMVDARLADGSRVNAIIPPIALKGPSITIRKFSSTPLKIGDLIGYGSLSSQMAGFLEAAVKGRCNIIVSGGTGSGKTTLLNVLSGYIPDSERIVTIEDAAELQLKQDHVVTLEGRPSNIEGKGIVSIRDLVKNALRMRPDRIIVGEVRSGETLDMLQAMNTGHDGSLTTVHANSSRDVVSRLETMVLMSGMELPAKAIREQITSAIDLIVHQSRLRDGSRKIINISEVVGMEGDTVTMQDIFSFRQNGTDGNGKIAGKFEPTGIHPKILDKIRENGGYCRDDWFLAERR